MKDVNIIITERSEHMTSYGMAAGAATQPKKERVAIEQQKGEIYFQTYDDPGSDTIVEVCVQSYLATRDDPSRIAINIVNSQEDTNVLRQSLSPENQKIVAESQRILQDHSSGITRELAKMEHLLETTLREMTRSDKQRAKFETKGERLNRAVRNWPLFRTTVLVVGGFWQMNHVIRYMKKHRIR